MDLITAGGLEAGAVVPQCLDNQYVREDAFRKLTSADVDYNAPEIQEERTRAAKTEFIRSLTYTSQVIINRAFFRNNEFLFNYYHPDNPEGLNSFAKLMNQGVIVPFLATQTTLSDPLDFNTAARGDIACSALLDKVQDDFRGLRFATDAEENLKLVKNLGVRFASYCSRLLHLDSSQKNEMASELFSDPTLLHDEEFEDNFHDALGELADLANAHAKDMQKLERRIKRDGVSLERLSNEEKKLMRPFPREKVYENFFIDMDSGRERPVSDGCFRILDDNSREIAYAIKKLVDLKYNSNLPDMLGRYTFTPLDMPSRMALQDEDLPGDKLDNIDGMIDEFSKVRQALMADTQREMYLPALEELTLKDVLKIRQFDEWNDFTNTQRQLLIDPLGKASMIHQLNRDFATLQLAIDGWYKKEYGNKVKEKKYKVLVSLGICIGASYFTLGIDDFDLIDRILRGAATVSIPDTSKGVMARLAFYVVDQTLGRIDRNRSWTLQIARSNEEFDRGYFLDCLKRIKESRQIDSDHPENLANQGKE